MLLRIGIASILVGVSLLGAQLIVMQITKEVRDTIKFYYDQKRKFFDLLEAERPPTNLKGGKVAQMKRTVN